jgi:hypothetical protein
MRRLLLLLLLCLWGATPLQADTLTNWELGFEIDVPTPWLRNEAGLEGLKLASDDVRLDIVPYSGLSQAAQIERLHKDTKTQGYQFKSEKSYPIHEVPAHEMVFYKDGQYLIYYVLMSGSRGFLITLRSQGQDSQAFRESQDIIPTFRVLPATR